MCDLGRQSIKLYYYEADIDIANTHRPTWDSQTYQLLDVVAADQVFTDDSDVFINRETRSLAVNSRGLYLAVRDQGSCTTIISLAVYYYVCPAVVKSLAMFSRTPTGRHLPDILPVHGVCVQHAVSSPPQLSPIYLCTSTGSWYLYTGTCHCEPGYQPNRQLTQCVVGQLDFFSAFFSRASKFSVISVASYGSPGAHSPSTSSNNFFSAHVLLMK